MTRTDPEDFRYVYPISVVERMTGLTRRRIRYYEQAGLIEPRRTPGRHRLYSEENVEMLRWIKALIDSGITTMESVRRMVKTGMDAGARQPAQSYPTGIEALRTPRSLGDAAVRVMRPVESRIDAAIKPGQSDSVAFFARTKVVPKPKDTRDRQ